jgi:hypothetical protein
VLKTRNLLIFRDAQNAKIAPNWNVSGTRTFQPARQFREARTEEATRKSLGSEAGGGGLLILPARFARTDFHVFCLR